MKSAGGDADSLKHEIGSLEHDRWNIRQIQRELLLSEEKFRQLADNIRDIFWIASPDLERIDYVSPGWEVITGSPVGDPATLKERWERAVHPEDRPKLAEFNRNLSSDFHDAAMDYRIIRADGKIRWVQNRAFQIRNSSGEAVRLTGIVSDITDRKEVEEKLRQSEARMRYLTASNPAVTLALKIVDGELELSFCSDNFRQFLHAGNESASTRDWWLDRLHPEDRERFCAAEKPPYPDDRQLIEYRFRKNDGSYFWIRDEKVLIRDEAGRPDEVIVSLVDISESKRAEEALLESENRFRETFEQVAVGMAHVSPQGEFLRVNKKLCDILAYSREHLLGMTCEDVILAEDYAELHAVRHQLLDGRMSSYTSEKRYLRSDGQAIWIQLATTLEKNSAGEPKYFTSVFQDITQRKLAEFRLHRLNRLHTVLSKTSEAVTRNRDIYELYHTVCRILVEDGRLVLAYVGELDTEKCLVIPVASHGEMAEGLIGAKITTDGSASSQGTMGTAILTGSHNVCNDILGDPRMAPWWERSKKYHFRSAASFPIKIGDVSVGALGLSASDTNYFQEDEIRLMIAVADQLSLALKMQQREQQRQKVEAALKASEHQFFSAFEYAAIGLALVGIKGNFLKVNRSLCMMLGFSDLQMLDFTFQEITYTDDLTEDLENLSQLIAGEIKSYQMEKRFVHQRGHLVWAMLSVSMVRDERGRPLHFIAQVQDITGKRQAHEAMRMQAHMLGHIGQAAIATDTDGRVIYANRFASDLYGWSAGEMMGRNIMDVTVPQIQQHEYDEIMGLLTQGQSWSGEVVVQRRDGRVFPSLTTSSPLLDNKGKLVGIIGISSDITARKQAEEMLRQKDALIRMAGRATRIGGWTVDLPSLKVTWSEEIFEMLGYKGYESPSLEGALSLYPEHSRAMVAEVLDLCAKEGRPFDIEVETFTAKRSLMWVRICGDAERDETGGIIRVQGAFQDISERKKSEQALRQSEQRYRSLVEATSSIVWDTPASGAFETEQLAWSAFTGQTFEELRGAGWLEAVHPDDREETVRVWARAVSEKSIYQVEHRLLSKDGKYHHMMVRGVPILREDGSVGQFIGIHTDITERKIAAENLAANEVLLRQFIQHTPAAIAMLDTELRYVQTSERWIQDYQLADREIIGKGHYEIFPDAPQRWREIHQRVLRGAIESCDEDPFPRADGSIDWLQWDARPWRNAQGEIGGLIFFTQVITARKEAEAEAERLNAQLINASRRAGMAEVATSVLHNVGNVLNSVNVSATLASEKIRHSGSSDLQRIVNLLDENREDLTIFFATPQGSRLPSFIAAVAEHLAIQEKSALDELQLLSSHIDHIKVIVSMQQNHARAAVINEDILPADLLDDALRFNAAALDRHQIEVVRQYADAPSLHLDKHKALQVIINLISNAKDAMEESDSLQKRLILRIECEHEMVKLSVIDSGAGILPENLPRLFEHGFTTRSSGHGFGLHSAALGAKELGGALSAHSDGPGRGAIFTLALPIPASDNL